MGTENKVNKGLVIGVVVGVIGIAFAVVAIVIALTNGKGSSTNEAEQPKKAVVTAENVEEVVEEFIAPEPVNIPQSYTVTQNSEWHFKDGNSESLDAYVENSTDNETPVYFDVYLDGTNELVYSSPVLELGASLSGIKLDKPLSAGTYDYTMVYHLVDDDQNELTTVQVGGTIIVEN